MECIKCQKRIVVLSIVVIQIITRRLIASVLKKMGLVYSEGEHLTIPNNIVLQKSISIISIE